MARSVVVVVEGGGGYNFNHVGGVKNSQLVDREENGKFKARYGRSVVVEKASGENIIVSYN